jgi:hypothetical protein
VDNKPASPPVEIQPEWPNGPAIKGKVYVMDTPFDHRIIMMSEESWGEFGTRLESLRQIAKKQHDRIKELLAESEARERVLADTLSRLDALRDIRRAEKRADLEAEINQS